MSRLYIRLMTGFYTHRKTARLRAVMGDDAYWVPPRLWAYCAENQPDGDLSGYDAPELAMLIGYNKDASSMLVALKSCGFMSNEGLIHDWDEHNGYHQKFSDRAKTAANARWSKGPPHTPPNEIESGKRTVDSKHCLKHACSIKDVFDRWNSLDGIPKTLVISDARRRKLESRLRDPFFVKNWQPALERIQASEFCKGSGEHGWKATFDWFLQPDSVAKAMEGKYDSRNWHVHKINRGPNI